MSIHPSDGRFLNLTAENSLLLPEPSCPSSWRKGSPKAPGGAILDADFRGRDLNRLEPDSTSRSTRLECRRSEGAGLSKKPGPSRDSSIRTPGPLAAEWGALHGPWKPEWRDWGVWGRRYGGCAGYIEEGAGQSNWYLWDQFGCCHSARGRR